MVRKCIVIVLICIAVLIGIIVGTFTINKNHLVSPKIAPVVDALYALGIVKVDRWYNLRFGMNAVVKKLYVVEGAEIAAGSPLLMTDSGVIFRAPFSGIITQVVFRESEIVPMGQTVMTLADTKTMYVRVSLDQKSIVRVRKGQKAELSFENLRDYRTDGIVESVYPSSNEFVVRIGVPRFPEGVLPEMNCDVAIIIRKNDAAMLVPTRAIANNEITIIRKGVQMRTQVEAQQVDKEYSEIIKGDIAPSDLIVIPAYKKNTHK